MSCVMSSLEWVLCIWGLWSLQLMSVTLSHYDLSPTHFSYTNRNIANTLSDLGHRRTYNGIMQHIKSGLLKYGIWGVRCGLGGHIIAFRYPWYLLLQRMFNLSIKVPYCSVQRTSSNGLTTTSGVYIFHIFSQRKISEDYNSICGWSKTLYSYILNNIQFFCTCT